MLFALVKILARNEERQSEHDKRGILYTVYAHSHKRIISSTIHRYLYMSSSCKWLTHYLNIPLAKPMALTDYTINDDNDILQLDHWSFSSGTT